ncbi:MAG: glycosyltransferase family 4 protein [Gammaproteobacteria bacterium]|nr:glycosyltransferase family 4 protein [Gammaproteobacteria bacterium]
MKIIELCLSPDLGGLELYMYRCCRELGKGAEVIPLVCEGGRLQQRLEAEGAKPQMVERRNRALPLLAARRLARLIDEEQVDIIHIHWTKDIPLAAFAKAFAKRKPMLVSTRQMQITRPKRDRYHDFLYRQIDLNITITEALAGDMRGLLNPAYADRVVPLYYGVAEPTEFLSAGARQALRDEMGIGPSTFLVCLVGRIKHYKGQHLLVEAIGKALQQGEDVAALIVGHAMEQDYLADLKRRVQENGWQGRILFRDFVEQPQRLMQACDVVALTTVEETFGLVLVEAMRAGVAVIGSDRGGVPEIIDHEKTGMLFRSTDGEDLYRQLQRLWQDRDLCARLAAAGKEKADRVFDEASHFSALRALLQQRYGAYLSAEKSR